MDALTIESKINDTFTLQPVKQVSTIENASNLILNPGTLEVQNAIIPRITKFPTKPFIEANTQEVNLFNLKNDCVIPVFSKDNERTIAHQEFIEIAQNCVLKVFPNHSFDSPEIRVSHQITDAK